MDKKLKQFLVKHWELSCFVYFCLVQLLLCPTVFREIFFYAEDGTIFFNGFIENGISSLVTMYGGYLTLLSRLIGGGAYTAMMLTNSMVVAGAVKEILSMMFVAAVMTYLASDCFEKFINGRKWRLIAGILLIILINNFVGLLFNSVGIHWWCGILAFLVAIELVEGKIPSWKIIFLMTLSILSSPSAFIVGFGAIYYIFRHKKFPVQFILPAIVFLIQGIVVLFMRGETVSLYAEGEQVLQSANLGVVGVINKVLSSVGLALASGAFSVGGYVYRQIFVGTNAGSFFTIAMIIIGGLLYGVTAYFAKKVDGLRYFYLAMLSIVALYFMISIKLENPLTLITDSVTFYHCAAAAIGFLVIYSTMRKFVPRLARRRKVVFRGRALTRSELRFLTLVGLVFLGGIYSLGSWSSSLCFMPNQSLHDVESFVDSSSDSYAVVVISPDWNGWEGRWFLKVPVREEFCENHECVSAQERPAIKDAWSRFAEEE